MNIIHPQRLEDFILKLLISGEQNTTALLLRIRTERKDTTKQGFYASLRKLKSEEVILIYKGVVSLNTVWIKKMKDVFEMLGRTYTTDQKSFDVLGLDDRESISYSFSTIKNLDIFWGHSQNILIHNTAINEPLYVYDPHYWFYIARRETEVELLNEIVQNKRQFLMTVGGKTKLDKSISKDFNNDFLQYSYKKIFDRDNYYVTVIEDYIIEVFLDEKISREIDQLFETANPGDQAVVQKLKTFLEAKVRNKIKISRNKSRAQKLKTILGKDFYIASKKEDTL